MQTQENTNSPLRNSRITIQSFQNVAQVRANMKLKKVKDRLQGYIIGQEEEQLFDVPISSDEIMFNDIDRIIQFGDVRVRLGEKYRQQKQVIERVLRKYERIGNATQ